MHVDSGFRSLCWMGLVLLTFSLKAFASALSPEEAVRSMTLADGFEVKIFASEPNIVQPVSVTFDSRGRAWVVQYLQYPTPSGVKVVSVDQYSRAFYDRLPAPPPKGSKGADRITICEDTDGDGRADKFKEFVTGLNMATGLALGHGGVFVAQAPYLLFYPDRDGDDIPEGDPVVLLSGFGMADTHSLVNSLIWGPDGWLYGAQGSGVVSTIRDIEFQQGIWRYHPLTKEFELFAEGGGNTWGVDFDRHGNLLASSNFGYGMFHQVQGAYYVKWAAKHGELHNPYAFGYFSHVPRENYKGTHVICGGIIYQGGSFPEYLHHQFIGGNLLDNEVHWYNVEPDGSTFKARFGGVLLAAHDPWFRPVDCLTGPDGSVFIVDWYDKQASHVGPRDDAWDRSNGRIYKIEAKGTKPVAAFDLSRESSKSVVKLLTHRNEWFASEARRILAERRDPDVLPILERNIFESKDERLALESLWALYGSGGWNQALAGKLLKHPQADIRAWAIRFIGDERTVSPASAKALVELARKDNSPTVRSQLACSAKRLSGTYALPIITQLLRRNEDIDDQFIPMLLWWALESKAISHRDEIVDLFRMPDLWRFPIVQKYVLERIGRRYVAEGTDQGLNTAAKILALSAGKPESRMVVSGIEKALEGRRTDTGLNQLKEIVEKLWPVKNPTAEWIRIGLRFEIPPSYPAAMMFIKNQEWAIGDRLSVIEVLSQLGRSDCLPLLLELLEQDNSEDFQMGLLGALERFPEQQVGSRLVKLYARLGENPRKRAISLLISRPASSLVLVQAVKAKEIDPKDVRFEQLRALMKHNNSQLSTLVEQLWGKVMADSPQEKKKIMNQVKSLLNPKAAGKGAPVRGREIFLTSCSVCHTLFNEGNSVGPDLTSADRKNTEELIYHIVDPSGYIRPEYVSYEAELKDERSMSGLLVESTATAVTIRDRNNQKTVLPRLDIKELKQSAVSLMPEGLLDTLTPQQILDLFAYLQIDEATAVIVKSSATTQEKK